MLQAYLPDSVAALDRLIEFAGAASRRGWRRHQGPTCQGRQPVDGAASTPSSTVGRRRPTAARRRSTRTTCGSSIGRSAPSSRGVLRVGVASHNLYDVALAHLLAERRGVAPALDVEMLQGMSPAQARAVKAAVGTVLLYTPVVAPEDFDVAVAYLVRRLEENAQPQNFLYACSPATAADSAGGRPVRARWPTRRRGSGRPSRRWRRRPSSRGGPRLRPPAQTRSPTPPTPIRPLPEVRQWAAERVAAAAPALTSPVLTSLDDVDRVVAAGRAAQPAWAHPAGHRASRDPAPRGRRARSAPRASSSRSWRPREARRLPRPTRRSPRRSTSPATTPTGHSSSNRPAGMPAPTAHASRRPR